jgi:hypothetical protein
VRSYPDLISLVTGSRDVLVGLTANGRLEERDLLPHPRYPMATL